MGADLLDALIEATLAGSLGVVLVLVLRVPVRRFFGAGAAYALWLAPLAMALAGLAPVPRAIAWFLPALLTPFEVEIGELVLAFWLSGAAILAVVLLLTHARFLRALGKPKLDDGGLPILRAHDDRLVGPAVIGVIAARIVLPADFDARYSTEQRAMVLAHERNHLFGHDPQAIAVSVALRCLNWFNPLAYLGGHLFRIDQELACDAAVLAQYPKARRTYAEALVKTQLAGAAPTFGCQWPAKARNSLEQRIALLGAPAKGAGRKRLGLALAAGLALAGSAFAWAAEPAPLVARPVAQIQLWAALKNDAAFLANARPVTLASGESITRDYETADEQYHLVTLTPSLTPKGRIVIRAEIARDRQVMSRASVELDEGEPKIIRVGDRNLVVTARVAAP